MLDAAISSHDVEQVRALLEAGADAHARDASGCTPLHMAAYWGCTAMVNVCGVPDFTPLHWAGNCYTRVYTADVAKALLEHGASVHARNNWGATPLHYAAMKGYTGIAGLLLEHGASVDARDNRGDTPLHRAAELDRGKTLGLLLVHGASVDARNNRGDTPLHYAVRNGQTETARLLLEHGADAHARDRWGDTPLHDAARYGHAGTVMLLLENGADAHARDHDGKTPLHRAAAFGRKRTAELLAAHAIRAAWRAHRPRARAARVIQRYWIRAYWDPNYRVCQARLRRDFAALAAEAAPMPVPAH